MDGQFQLTFRLRGHYYPVDLCHRNVLLGQTSIQHVWIDIRTLYVPHASKNSSSIVNYFWDFCIAKGSALDAGVQMSYLLARLLPKSRPNGARRIVPDA